MAITRFRGEHFFLSNMYPFEHGVKTPDGVVIHTSEQLYLPPRLMERAARLAVEEAQNGFEAKKTFRRIIEEGSPTREDWDTVKVGVMRDCVMLKFGINSDLAERLLGTGDKQLIEGNTWGDNFWGVSPPPDESERLNERGINMLGRILMDTREALRSPDFSVDADALVRRIFAAGSSSPVSN